VNSDDKNHPFEPGQRLLRHVGKDKGVEPVTFIAPSPRLVVITGKEVATKASPTAIVRTEDGAVQSVPLEELDPDPGENWSMLDPVKKRSSHHDT
jgi:hypothetical protein